MPTKLTGINVFIASPGNLGDERRIFQRVIEQVNRDAARDAGIIFVPKGWEYAIAGMGRPQEVINEQVEDSDYLIVVLWDRWGRPPGGMSDYSSGTEEEFRVAKQCLQSDDKPMIDIVVLFKGVDGRQMSDPGEQLRRVIDFKKELETTRELLYSNFDSELEFEDGIRSHLHQWIRDWQGGVAPAKRRAVNETVAVTPNRDDQDDSSGNGGADGREMSLAAQAKEAFRRGRLTQAEQLFASAVSGRYDREALTENVRFLRKSGRLSAAETAATDFLQDARDADDRTGEIEALANLGILRRQQGDNDAAILYFDQALKSARELADDPLADQNTRVAALETQAFLLDNQSLSLRRQPGGSVEALEKLSEARRIQDRVGDRRGAGFTSRNTGTLLLRLGDLDEAERALKESLAIFEEVDYVNGQAAALSSLAELYEAKFEYRQALEALNRSVAVSPERNPNRVAMNYGALTRILIKLGDLELAREYSARCTRFSHELGTAESQANALHCEAQVAMADNKVEVAKSLLLDALDLFREVSNRIGTGAVLLNLARIDLIASDIQSARERTRLAEDALRESPHYGLSAEAKELIAAIDKADPEK